MNTLPKSSSPYDSISMPLLTDLVTVVHFTLLFGEELELAAHELLFPKPENSLLAGEGAVFEALVHHISTIKNQKSGDVRKVLHAEAPETRMASIAYDLSECAQKNTIRAKVTMADGRVGNSARLRAGVRDGFGTGYVWVRGADGCASGRVVASGRVWAGEDLRHVADAIDIRGRSGGGRADLLVALWLRERADKSMARASRVHLEWEEERARRREEELKRQRRVSNSMGRVGLDTDGCILLSGEKIIMNEFGRGKRERRHVNYNDKVGSGIDVDNYRTLENEVEEEEEGGEGNGEANDKEGEGDGEEEEEGEGEEEEEGEENEEEEEFVVDSGDEDDNEVDGDNDGTDDDDHDLEGTDGWDPQEEDEMSGFEKYNDRSSRGYENKKGGSKRLRRSDDGGWAGRIESFALRGTRTDNIDFELNKNSTSRAERAARRSELRALQV